MTLEFMKGDSRKGSDDTPMFNPHILPLNARTGFYTTREEESEMSIDQTMVLLKIIKSVTKGPHNVTGMRFLTYQTVFVNIFSNPLILKEFIHLCLIS